MLPISWLVTPHDTGGAEPATLVVFHSPEHGQDPGLQPEATAEPLSELERLTPAETTTQPNDVQAIKPDVRVEPCQMM